MFNLIASTVNALFATSRPGTIELTAGEAALGVAAGAGKRHSFFPPSDRRVKPCGFIPLKP